MIISTYLGSKCGPISLKFFPGSRNAKQPGGCFSEAIIIIRQSPAQIQKPLLRHAPPKKNYPQLKTSHIVHKKRNNPQPESPGVLKLNSWESGDKTPRANLEKTHFRSPLSRACRAREDGFNLKAYFFFFFAFNRKNYINILDDINTPFNFLPGSQNTKRGASVKEAIRQ